MKFKSLLFSALVSFGALDAAIFDYTTSTGDVDCEDCVIRFISFEDISRKFSNSKEIIRTILTSDSIKSALLHGFESCSSKMAKTKTDDVCIDVMNKSKNKHYIDTKYNVFETLRLICDFDRVCFCLQKREGKLGIYGRFILCKDNLRVDFIFNSVYSEPIAVDVSDGANTKRLLFH